VRSIQREGVPKSRMWGSSPIGLNWRQQDLTILHLIQNPGGRTGFLAASGLATGAADLGADFLEGDVGVASQQGDGGNAHHDDQGQHHGILDGGWAILVTQEREDALAEMRQHSHSFRES